MVASHQQKKLPRPTDEEFAEMEEVDYETEDLWTTLKGVCSFTLFRVILPASFFLCKLVRDLICGPPDSSIVKGKTPLLKIMSRLQVTEREATQFFKLFEKIDGDHSGTIEIDEFFTFFKLPPTQFAKRAFSVMDFEGGKHETEKEIRMKLKRSKSTMLGHGKKSAKGACAASAAEADLLLPNAKKASAKSASEASKKKKVLLQRKRVTSGQSGGDPPNPPFSRRAVEAGAG
jgi:hypothetical protein